MFKIYIERSRNMDNLGETIRKLREEKKLPLRTVAAFLDIDQAILSKIERGQRKATRGHVIKLAEYFKVKESDLLVSWLSDKLVYEVADEQVALKALQVAEEKVKYKAMGSTDSKLIIEKIKKVLKKDGRVALAWIFGSFARGDNKANSDIDLMVRFKNASKISLFDYADIAHIIEQEVKIKVDLVEEGYLQPFALESAKKDFKLIYG